MKFIPLLFVYSLYTHIFLFKFIDCTCGNTTLIPSGPSDCVPYSTESDICCYLTVMEAPATYSNCISLKPENLSPYFQVGNMQYKVNCTGVNDYKKLFPFEENYSHCGINNPTLPSECAKYDHDDNPCCLASTDPTFNETSHLLCYRYPSNPLKLKKNYTEISNDEMKLHFSCSCSNISLVYSVLFVIMIFIF